jgi:protein-L-isoaspartate(D-aspartate) O-methyltransferase
MRRREVPERPAEESVERMEFLLALRRHGIVDQAVLRAMDEVPREHFVEPHLTDAAYADHALPIACGQTISQPYVVAYMTEQLAVRPEHRVLEVGTGSGYQAAVLSRLATLGYRNVEIMVGDGLIGLPVRAPFDRIIVTAAAEGIPETLTDQLAENGIMVLPLGPHSGAQQLIKLTKTRSGFAREDLIAVRFVPLLPGRAREL